MGPALPSRVFSRRIVGVGAGRECGFEVSAALIGAEEVRKWSGGASS